MRFGFLNTLEDPQAARVTPACSMTCESKPMIAIKILELQEITGAGPSSPTPPSKVFPCQYHAVSRPVKRARDSCRSENYQPLKPFREGEV